MASTRWGYEISSTFEKAKFSLVLEIWTKSEKYNALSSAVLREVSFVEFLIIPLVSDAHFLFQLSSTKWTAVLQTLVIQLARHKYFCRSIKIFFLKGDISSKCLILESWDLLKLIVLGSNIMTLNKLKIDWKSLSPSCCGHLPTWLSQGY